MLFWKFFEGKTLFLIVALIWFESQIRFEFEKLYLLFGGRLGGWIYFTCAVSRSQKRTKIFSGKQLIGMMKKLGLSYKITKNSCTSECAYFHNYFICLTYSSWAPHEQATTISGTFLFSQRSLIAKFKICFYTDKKSYSR